MYNFTFGTYSGLFVECETPAVLPTDLSFFDFRRGKHTVPSDNSPNVVIKKIGSQDSNDDWELLLIALVYKAKEGARTGGFVGFGSILVSNHQQSNIKVALQKAINLANKSDDFFSEGKIFGRPKSNSSKKIDLRDLPIHGKIECFGQIKATLSDPNALDKLSSVTENLCTSYDSFEIIINEKKGVDAAEIGPYLDEQLNQEMRKRQKDIQVRQKRLNEEKLKNFSGRKPKTSNTPLVIGMALATISIFCAALIVFLIFRTGPSEIPSTVAEIVEEQTEAIDNELPIQEETENISNDEETTSENLTQIGCENIANTPPQAGEKFLSSRIDFLNTATDKTDGCVDLGDNAQDFLYIDNDTINHIKYDPQVYDSIHKYFDKEFSDNEYHLIRFKDFLASFDDRSSTFKWLVSAENQNKYGLAISTPKINEQTMYCTAKTFELVNDATNRFRIAYLSQSNAIYENLIKTMATSFIEHFSNSWGELDNAIETRASTVMTDNQSVEIIERFYLDNILSLEATSLVDLTNIEAQENLCVLSFSEQDQLNLSKVQNLREVSLNEYFKKAHGLEKIRENLGVSSAVPFEQYLPNCIGIPEYILVWNAENPMTGKGVLKDFEIMIGRTTKLDFMFVRSDAIIDSDDYIQLPEVDTAMTAFRELKRLMEVNAGSPFTPDFVPVDQICLNN